MSECSICLDGIAEMEYMITLCDHTFHTDCLRIWLLRAENCPICRQKLIEKEWEVYGDKILVVEYCPNKYQPFWKRTTSFFRRSCERVYIHPSQSLYFQPWSHPPYPGPTPMSLLNLPPLVLPLQPLPTDDEPSSPGRTPLPLVRVDSTPRQPLRSLRQATLCDTVASWFGFPILNSRRR